MKKLILVVLCLAFGITAYSQTEAELKAEQATKKDSISAIQGRIDAIQATIDALPGWKLGALGIIGGDFSNFNNWYAQGIPNNSSGSIGFTVNAYANLKRTKYFWRNSLNLNLKWVKLDDKDNPADESGFRGTTDVFNVSSLYGWNLSEKFAVSALGEYRTTLIDNFNDPGYLDLGVGGTWTPVTDLVVVIHPANYNFVFASDNPVFESSFGAKIVADYIKKIGGLKLKTNLSIFQSYKSNNLSNWTWTNTFTYTLWKVIGLGFDFGLRDNKQEALNYEIFTLGNTDATFDTIDNRLQTFWTLGISYSID